MRIVDDREREIIFAQPPQRVVCLVPSDTFTVAALGAGSVLVGRTDYCELPEDLVVKLPTVGGTKNPRIDDICDLKPDVVITNQEENSRSDLEELVRRGLRVYVSFPKRVAEGLAHLAKVARMLGIDGEPAARELVKRGYDALRDAEASKVERRPLRTFCPIWADPLMTIHGATYMSDVLDLTGAHNVFVDRERRYPLAADLGQAVPYPEARVVDRDVRYPRVTLEEVVERQPELVLLPDEPHAFTEAEAEGYRQALQSAGVQSDVLSISGKDLAWYGARSIEGLGRVRAQVDSVRHHSSSRIHIPGPRSR